MQVAFIFVALCFSVSLSRAADIALYCPPTPYRSVADNPFRAGITAGTMFLEDFEDGRANTPYLYEGEDILLGGRNTIGVTQFLVGENNSVDGDDGSLDGADLLGVGWMGLFSGGSRISFVFEPRVLADGRRQFPTYFGFAITAGMGSDETGVSFTDENENLLGGFRLPREALLEYQAGQRGVITDRFFAMYVPTGAEIMHIDLGIYTIDHLTYGWNPIPEPGVAGLAGLASLVMLGWRTQRKEHGCCEA